MKKYMQVNGEEIDFREPFFLYDIISVYDKSKQTYVPKRRSTAVSYSDTEEIIIAMTICSDKDTFVTSIARNILVGRIKKALSDYIDRSEPTYMGSFADGTYLFTDYESYIQYCNTVDAMADQFFAPYKVKYAARVNKPLEEIRVDSYSDLYLHKKFVETTWPQFCTSLVSDYSKLDTTAFLNGTAQEQYSDAAVSR